MTKTTADDTIVKREVGERVDISLGLDSSLTKELGEGVLEATITTSNTDRHNENIVTDGINVDAYMNNPVVLYGHDYQGLPIGKTIKLTTMKNKIKARFQLAVEEYPFAKTVYDMVKNGYLNAVSIGGIVREWSDDYRSILQMEMVEFSVVPVPANAEAIITARSFEQATGKTMETVAKEFEEFIQGSMLDKVKAMGDDDVSQAIKVLKNLVATLEESAKPTHSIENLQPVEVKRIKRITLNASAKAVATQSQHVIKIIKFRSEHNE